MCQYWWECCSLSTNKFVFFRWWWFCSRCLLSYRPCSVSGSTTRRLSRWVTCPNMSFKWEISAHPHGTICWAHVLPQAVCAIFEKSVKTLLHEFAPMVSQLSEMLGQMYSTIPQASALDLTRQVHTHECVQTCIHLYFLMLRCMYVNFMTWNLANSQMWARDLIFFGLFCALLHDFESTWAENKEDTSRTVLTAQLVSLYCQSKCCSKKERLRVHTYNIKAGFKEWLEIGEQSDMNPLCVIWASQ